MSISDFALSYQKSPIILQGGIVANMPGQVLPIISLTQGAQYGLGPTNIVTSSTLNLEDFLFDFFPMPGGKLIEQQVATYPFANQAVAANAVIAEPLSISLMMLAPPRGSGAYSAKSSIFPSLQSTLQQHNSQGGTYIVATPSYIYTNCLLLSLRDASDGDPKLPQWRWQWDFFQPLLTLAAAGAQQMALNGRMSQISSGAKVTPDANGYVGYSGLQPNVGNSNSIVGPSVIPAASPLSGASVPGYGLQDPSI